MRHKELSRLRLTRKPGRERAAPASDATQPRHAELPSLALRRRWECLTLAVAAVVRVATLDQQSFWYDEALTVEHVHGSFSDVMEHVHGTEATPPLYFLLAWVWSQVFGIGEVGLRSLSTVIGIVTVALVIAATQRLTDRRTARFAGALAALNPFLIYYAQEARAYALLVLLTFSSVAAAAIAVRERRQAWVAAWAVTAGLALLTHYFAVLIVVPTALWLLLAYPTRRTAAIAVGFVGVIGLALLPRLIDQRSSGRTDWVTASPLHTRLLHLPEEILAGPEAWRPIPLAALALAGLTTAIAAGCCSPAGHRDVAMGMGLLAAADIAIALVFALGGLDAILPRNFIPVAPLLIVGAATAVAPALDSRSGKVRIAALGGSAIVILIGLAGIVAPIADRDMRRRPDWRATARTLTAGGRPDFVVLAPPSEHARSGSTCR
jgi:mannosyltransferase